MIYVASSWRNPLYDGVVAILHAAQLPLYDFKHPKAGHAGFHWHAIDPEWETWSAEAYRKALADPRAAEGFTLDMDALKACDTLVLVLPCGRSAHLELGYAIGAGKRDDHLLSPWRPDGARADVQSGGPYRAIGQGTVGRAGGERRTCGHCHSINLGHR